jgi:oxygen-independent coproporphyrinogen-3 oxidase
MCQFKTSWENPNLQFSELPMVLKHLYELEQDGLLVRTADSISVTEKGKPFVRNICMAFDLHMNRKAPETKLFSMTI